MLDKDNRAAGIAIDLSWLARLGNPPVRAYPLKSHQRLFTSLCEALVPRGSLFITRMHGYHQYTVLHIISTEGAVYHQSEAVSFFMHGRAVMIYKGQALDDMQRLAAFDDMPNLSTLRFGYKKCRKNPTFFVLVNQTLIKRTPLLLSKVASHLC